MNDQTGSDADSASLRWPKVIAFITVAFIGCFADLATKLMAFRHLGMPARDRAQIYWIVPNYFGLETALNHGAVFGAGQGLVWLFASMSFLALAGIGYWLFAKGAIDSWFLTLVLALITGGILGNLYDRLGLWSDFQIFAVRDWIRFSYRDQFVWPNFNIADSLLVVGATLLMGHAFFYDPKR